MRTCNFGVGKHSDLKKQLLSKFVVAANASLFLILSIFNARLVS